MSLQVQLEPDDRKFIKEAKGWWAEAKRQMVWMLIALVFGFVLANYIHGMPQLLIAKY